MTKRARLAGPSLLFLLAACRAGADDAAASASANVEAATDLPYPAELRPIRRLDGLDPSGVSIGDFGSAVRDQGSIASCASHGFVGLLENQLFNDRGITVDLAERYQLFGNYFATGNMGNDPAVILKFPAIAADLGLMGESAYPYADVIPNAGRFAQDAAQGLSTDPNAVTVDKAIAATAARSTARSAILQKGEFLGRLPAGPYPVVLPMKATLAPAARVPELELGGKIVPCFSAEGPAGLPESRRLAVTPREFAAKCLALDPTAYFGCTTDVGALLDAESAGVASVDDCAGLAGATTRAAEKLVARNSGYLALTLELLRQGQAVMVGVQAPSDWGPLTVWSSRFAPGGGHAVLVIGSLTYAELKEPAEQDRGILADGLFDSLATGIEPEYGARIAGGLPADAAARRDLRLATKLARVMSEEGGLLAFRNSWGAKVGETAIGANGYQSMTFDYFLKIATLVQARASTKVGGVDWAPGAGPETCPAIALRSSDPWLAADHTASVATHLLRQINARCVAP